MKKLRIALIVPEGLPVPAVRGGAVEGIVDDLTQGLCGKFDFYVFSTHHADLKKIKLNPQIHYFHLKISLFDRIKYVLKNLKSDYYTYLDHCIKKIKKIYPDLILIQNYPRYVLPIKKNFPDIPIVLHMHNRHLAGGHDSGDRENKKVIEAVDKIICVSRFIEQDILKKHGQKYGSKTTVIYNGIKNDEMPKFSSSQKRLLRKKFGFAKTDKIFLYAGRIVSEKGVSQLIEAFKKIEMNNKKLILLGFGQNTLKNAVEYEENILKTIPKDIICLPRKSKKEVFEYMAAADLLVLPSIIEEALGMVVLEALALGTPVLTSKAGGIPESAGAQKYFINNVKNINEFSSKMVLALRSPTKTLKNHLQKFEIKNVSKQFANELNHILSII